MRPDRPVQGRLEGVRSLSWDSGSPEDAGFGDVSVESLAVVVYSLANDVESLAVAGAVCGSVAPADRRAVATGAEVT